jgi:hypothetical protein
MAEPSFQAGETAAMDVLMSFALIKVYSESEGMQSGEVGGFGHFLTAR